MGDEFEYKDWKYKRVWLDGVNTFVPIGWSVANQELSAEVKTNTLTGRWIHCLIDPTIYNGEGIPRPARRITDSMLQAAEMKYAEVCLYILYSECQLILDCVYQERGLLENYNVKQAQV
jgi:hypothetical protein